MQDSAACLLLDGEVAAAVEEERLSRVKHTGAFPEQAIRWCLEDAGVSVGDLDHVAFNMRPWEGIAARARQLVTTLPSSLATVRSRGGSWAKMMTAPMHFAKAIGRGRYDWHWVRHHEAHAASAAFVSPFERAAVLIVDGSGELASASTYDFDGRGLAPLSTAPFPHSLGYYYSALTEYLGFRPAVCEYKTMGLASFGSPEPGLMQHFRAMIADDGTIDTRWFRYQLGGERYFSERWVEHFGPARTAESALTDRHYAVAAAGQRRLEEVLFAMLRTLHDRVGVPDLCMAGGVALNSAANGKICEETDFERVWIQPVAHDAGTAYGAALHVHCATLGRGRPAPQTSVAFGPRYTADAVDSACARAGVSARVCADLMAEAASLLASGRVVGWFRGRCELGPRALGNRSILADPRNPEAAGHVNAKIKRREAFRPFAPAVLDSDAEHWFSGPCSPFMTTVHTVIREGVPAVTHVDKTARVQAVSAADAPGFHALITAFKRLTGAGVLLNTSFNLRGEPIVCSPDDAIKDYLGADMDALVLEDRLLIKPARAGS